MPLSDFGQARFDILEFLFPASPEVCWDFLNENRACHHSCREPNPLPSAVIPTRMLGELKNRLLAAKAAAVPEADRQLLAILKKFPETACEEWDRNKRGGWGYLNLPHAIFEAIPDGVVVYMDDDGCRSSYAFPELTASDWKPNSESEIVEISDTTEDADDEPKPNTEPAKTPLESFQAFYNSQSPEIQAILAKRLPELLKAWTGIANKSEV